MPSKKPTRPAPQTAHDDPDLRLIARLAGILNETGLTEIELDRKGSRVRVSKAAVAVPQTPAVFHGHHAPAAPATAAEPASLPATKPSGDHPGTVKSPMVGTVYMAPSPGSPLFIEVGATVKEGQTLLIIEAMKTMNQINAPRGGKVTHIFVENAQPVEYGEALVTIE